MKKSVAQKKTQVLPAVRGGLYWIRTSDPYSVKVML